MKYFFEQGRIQRILFVCCLSTISNFIVLNAQVAPKSGNALMTAGIDCFDEEEFPLAVDLLTQAVEISSREMDKSTLIDAYYYLALAKFWVGRYENSNEHFYLLINEYPALLNREDSMNILRYISQNHYYMGNYDVAHELALERLRSTERLKDSFNIAKSYQVLGEIECRQKDFKTALKHVQLSKQMFEKMRDSNELSFNLDLMGDIFHNTGKYKDALDYKIKSCQVIDTTLSLYDNSYCNHTIALTLSKMGRYDEAIPLFKLSLANWVKAGLPEETAMTRACLGEALAWSGQCNKGIELMKDALHEIEGLSLRPLRREILEKLFQVNKHCGQIEAAFSYLEKYTTVNDSLNNQNAKVRIASLSNNYQLEKKNAELEVMKHTERVRAQYIIFLLTGVAVLICLAMFISYLLKKQRDYSFQLDAKSKQIAQQYEDIHLANEKLTLANKELEQFAYVASHDMKTPLRTIGNYSSLVNRRYSDKLDEDGVTFLRYITEAAKHMNGLLEDIFAYSRVSKGEVEIGKVNMQEKLEFSLRLLNESIESKQAEVQYDPLPTILGNPTQLYQLIQNLLDNALKFIKEGCKPLIQVRLTEVGDLYQFSVHDNGIGIPENKHHEVFTIFRRLHTSEEYNGTGIGLSICKKIVEAHGGHIWIESDGKTGTIFHFTMKKMEETADGLVPVSKI
ncbi:MAG: GHKL domain-containing protein [Saprospiraceae bacterium]|nr:GHKL domain-containing protein [Saprospiraceae bacterium]MCF8252715.1 GHKL domain-containing protein [Saprospiraceae bacterium]MCF8282939.1 GHKL domain-containing protein [Bacteroidales bacterium]MCF8314284.1 GHKL domain-containing protein [Saprospiraceae bacterium]MCF8443113.1 GHKL domain-containing protein [Saprospiraceae bacterium]